MPSRRAPYVGWSCVDQACSELAVHSKGALTEDELRNCFAMMCGPNADEALWERFQTVYHQRRKQRYGGNRIRLVQTYGVTDRLRLVDSSISVD